MIARLALTGLLATALPAQAAEPLRAERLWVREAPPVAKVLAAYGRLCNDTDADIVIEGVAAEGFARAEVHRTVEKDGRTSMRHLRSLTVSANDCVALEPGGLHVMLFDPAGPLRAGDTVSFIFSLAGRDPVTLTAPVERQQDHHDHHQHGHGHEH